MQSTIAVGSSFDLDAMATKAIAGPLLAYNSVEFYGHMNGIGAIKADGNEASLLSMWANTGAGTIESSIDDALAVMSVTIRNTGASSITIPVGTIVSSASGIKYQVLETDDGSGGWSSGGTGDGSVGYYTIAAGASLTVNAQCTTIGIAGNLLANQVTQIGIANASITASTLELYLPQLSHGTVTVRNTTSSTINIGEGTVLTGTNGTYQIGNDPTVSGWVIGTPDSADGYYALPAGASVALPFYSTTALTGSTYNAILVQELSANDASTNSIMSSSLPAGISIVGSSAITSAGVTNAAMVGKYGGWGPNSGFWTDIGFYAYTTQLGYKPTEANVDVEDNYIWTANDLRVWKAYVDAARAQGVLNLAFMVSGFNSVAFASSTATQYVRAAALYSGGICFDFPPWFALAQGSAFITATENEIKWANANGIRSSITLSPENADDTSFLADTQTIIAQFKAAGALPSQIVVKDGGVFSTSSEGNIFSTSFADSLNNVGLWLAKNVTLTPTNSEASLQSRGTTTRPDMLMTGVPPSTTATSTATMSPYAAVQVFAESKTTTITASVSLSSTSVGTLSTSGSGPVSTGSSYSITGTPAQVTAGLQALKFNALANGPDILTLTLTDAVGQVVGTTVLTVALSN
ncbi:MAG: baseplate J/gp47 family protein [Janthinobacterium lividum]